MPVTLQEVASLSRTDWEAIVAAPAAEAAQWMTAAARLGHAEAQAVMGQWLLDGHGMPRNPDSAFAWFRRAADQGHAMGMNMAGRCCENGWGTEVDLPAAARWFRLAANKGLDAGMYNLANQLAAGHGIAQDRAEALSLYRSAAALGNVKSLAKIGRYYEDGLVVEKDLAQAFHCYRLGAEGGDFRAQFSHAGMLAAQGRNDEALSWLRKVPLTATPAYLAEVGALLAASSDPAFQAVGREMLARAA
jgi:TPR repeat protein